MKIAFIGQKGIPARSGGIETHVEEVATRMAEMGHEVFVYVRNNYTEKNLYRYKNVHLIHLPSIPTKRLDAITHTFLATVDSLFGKYDIVHYHGIGPSSLSWIVKLLKRKTAVVSTFHCQDYFHQKWNLDGKLYLKLGEFITCTVPDKTISVSKSLGEFAKIKYGAETTVIPNGADVHYDEKTDKLTQWELKDKKYIIYVGRLIKHKGVHYLIEAFKKLEDTSRVSNNFKLVIVGDGAHTDDYVKYLHTISEGRENIIFTGSQNGETLRQLFSHAYLFVQPSESEGMSIALLEAMGYGLCVLASDIVENKEPIGDSGFLFESKNAADLTEKLAFLLNSHDQVRKTGEAAKKRIDQQYSWASIAKQTVAVYEDAIEMKKGKKIYERNLCKN